MELGLEDVLGSYSSQAAPDQAADLSAREEFVQNRSQGNWKILPTDLIGDEEQEIKIYELKRRLFHLNEIRKAAPLPFEKFNKPDDDDMFVSRDEIIETIDEHNGELNIEAPHHVPTPDHSFFHHQESFQKLMSAGGTKAAFILDDTGTGKSCKILGAIEVALINRVNELGNITGMKTVILCPAELQEKEMRKQLACVCTEGKYEVPIEYLNFKEKTDKKSKMATVVLSVSKSIQRGGRKLWEEEKKIPPSMLPVRLQKHDGITINSFGKFAKMISRDFPEVNDNHALRLLFRGLILVIDELHTRRISASHFMPKGDRPPLMSIESIWDPEVLELMGEVDRLKSKYEDWQERASRYKDKVKRYFQIFRVRHLATNERVIGLTATPFVSNLHNMISQFNLIAPINRQLPFDFFYKSERNYNKYFGNILSYIRAAEVGSKLEVIGQEINDNPRVVAKVGVMSRFQYEGYERAIQGTNVIFLSDFLASLFVFPDGVAGNGTGKLTSTAKVEKIDKLKKYDYTDKQIPVTVKSLNLSNLKESFNIQKAEMTRSCPINIFAESSTYNVSYYPHLNGANRYIEENPPGFFRAKNNEDGRLLQDILSNIQVLKDYGVTYANLINTFLNEEGNCLVFSRFITGSGSGILDVALPLYEYEQLCDADDGRTIRMKKKFTRFVGDISAFANDNNNDVEPFCKMRKKFGSSADISTNRLAGIFARAPRYAFITGKTDQNASNILELFNSPENVNGEYIKILIISSIAGVGINIENVRQIHILGGLFTEADEKQAINRCLRVDSYINLLNYIETKYGRQARENFRVKLFMHCTAFRLSYDPNNPLYNQSGFSKNAEVTIRSKVIGVTLQQELAKLIAHTYDCQLNYWRNHRIDDQDYSKECAGDKCLIPCADPFVITKPESFIEGRDYDGMYRNVEKIFQAAHDSLSYDEQGNWTNVTASFPLNRYTTPAFQYRQRNYQTYDIFYSGPEINNISDKIKQYFRFNPNASIDRLSVVINARKKLLLLALTKIISNCEIIIDAYGNPCYLQENNNMFFLISEYPMRRNVFSGNAALIMHGEKKTNIEDLTEIDYPSLERYVSAAEVFVKKININDVIHFSRYASSIEQHQNEFFAVKRNLYRLPANTLILYLQLAIQNYLAKKYTAVEYFTLVLFRNYLIMIPNFSNMTPLLKNSPEEFGFGSNKGKKRTNALKLKNFSIQELDRLLARPFTKFRQYTSWLYVNLASIFKLSGDMYRAVSAIYKIETDISVFEEGKWRKLVSDENFLYSMYLQFYVKHLLIRTSEPMSMPYFANTFPSRVLPRGVPLERLRLPYLIVIPIIGSLQNKRDKRVDADNLAPLVLQELEPANSEFDFGRKIKTIGGYETSMLLSRIATPEKQKQVTRRGGDASHSVFSRTANFLYYLNWQSSDFLHTSTYFEFWFKLRLAVNFSMQMKKYWFDLFCTNVKRWSDYLPFIYEIINSIESKLDDTHLTVLKCFGVTESEQIAYNYYQDFITIQAIPDDRLSWRMRGALVQKILSLVPESDRHIYWAVFQEARNFSDGFVAPPLLRGADPNSTIFGINSFGIFFHTFCSALNNWRSIYAFFAYLTKQMMADFDRIVKENIQDSSYGLVLYQACGLFLDEPSTDLRAWLQGNFAPQIYQVIQTQLTNLPALICNRQVTERINQLLQANSRFNFYALIQNCFERLSTYYEIVRALGMLYFEDISGYTSLTIHSITRSLPDSKELKLTSVRHMFFNPGKPISYKELLESVSDNNMYGAPGYSGSDGATKYAPNQAGQFWYWTGEPIPEKSVFSSENQLTYNRTEYISLEDALSGPDESQIEQIISTETIKEWLKGSSSDLFNSESDYYKIRNWMQFKRLNLYKDYLKQINYYGMVLLYNQDALYHHPELNEKVPLQVLTKLLLYYLFRDNHFFSFEI